MADPFEDIVSNLIVSGWHAAWRSAQLKLHTHTDDFATAIDIGREAWGSVPADQMQDALDELFNAYWKATSDQDIRNGLEETPEVGVDIAAIHAAIDHAARTGVAEVTVGLRAVARVMADMEALHIHRRYCPRGDLGETG